LIVFPDADLDLAAATAMAGVWGGSGQFYTAGSRVTAHSKVHVQLVSTVVEQSKVLEIGGGFDPDAKIGPLVTAQQLEHAHGFVSIGQEEGAHLTLGGERVGEKGFFHQPTVFTEVRNDMRIAQEEIFGPVMSVLGFEDEEEVYRWANESEYGLAAGVFTNDLARAHRAARALKAGTVWLNAYQLTYPTVSYGGVKHSGHGRMLCQADLEEPTQIKTVWMQVGAPLSPRAVS
jgi:acyl-CoA reductase-like NAD-dependent aldehyde dehydrogenase